MIPQRSDYGKELMLAESLVGPLQSVLTERLSVERFVDLSAKLSSTFAVDAHFVERVRQRVRQVMGAWKATPFAGTLELTWPAREPPRVLPL